MGIDPGKPLVQTDQILRLVSRDPGKGLRARRVRLLSQTDYSVSTTGNLGPDVLEGKDRGLVYVAACSAERTISGELHLNGSREENKEEAAASALRLLVELLES